MTETKVLTSEPKTYEELDFTDDFMFCKVMTHNLTLCKELLEIILEKKIKKVELSQSQKEIKITYDGKGVRLDVYVEDEENTVYDTEMQATDTKNLPKRSRYYQGMIDLNLISKGENYKKLKKSYIIFICKFDPFGENLCRYTFKNLCVEQPKIELADETVKVFINPYGRTENLSEDLREFLKYLAEDKSESQFTQELAREVDRARKQEEWKVEYMTLFMRDQENIEKGMAYGIAESIIMVLEAKGEVPEELKSTIYSQDECEVLIQWMKVASKSDTIDTFMENM